MVEKDRLSPGAKRRRSSGSTRRSLDLSVNQETEEQPQKSSIHVRKTFLSSADNFCKQFGPRSGPTKCGA